MDRKKIFGIFGGFLAVMLGFTILSRGVSGASMARVETVKISTGTIDHTVTGSGRVEAGKEVAVYTESGQRVKEICVREGQTVEEGELLFTIDMEELEEQILAARQEMEKARLQNQDAQSAGSVEQRERELRKNRAQEDYSQAVSQGDADVAAAKAALDEAQRALEDFLNNPVPEAEKDNFQEDMEDSRQQDGSGSEDKEDGEGAENPGQPRTDEEDQEPEPEQDTSQWESEKARLEQAVSEAQAAYESALSSRAEHVKTAARELEDASLQKAADSTSKQNEITRQQQELALDKLLVLQEAEGKITAPVRGMITDISIVTGDFTTEGTAMRLADTSQGGRLTVSVDKFNEEYVGKGSPVIITPSGSKEKLGGYTVTAVTENEEDDSLLDVTVDLPEGVLEAGTAAEVEITQKSENYSTVLPVQALREEERGYYVLVVQEEQGVMGSELVVRRLDVKVRDKNDVKAALEDGVLTGDQEVVSASSRALEEGSRVRKKES